ncbi:MAG: peptidoglycan DD-metalloendopeptidase family protein [Hyphomicrobiales bacterium]|nr:peptidoglycan DD-metalloendopeptidase family protein [Hyphomicrobiales bacterium]
MRMAGGASRALALGVMLAMACGTARADPNGSTPPGSAAPKPTDTDQQTRLRGVEDTMRASDEQRRRIEADIETIRADKARLTAALIDTTAKVQDSERQIAAANERLASLSASADALAKSLDNRRGVIADVLGVLQRMGANPPPAILVRPQDMSEAIHAAMVLGSTVRELKSETEALRKDLDQLAALRVSIGKERDDLAAKSADLAIEKTRLTALIDARQQSLSTAEQALTAQKQRDADLAAQAATLKDLIARAEAAASAATSADQAAAADIAARAAAARSVDPARLKPAVAFIDAKGLLPLPVAGAILKTFGATDLSGIPEKGVSMATPPGATVSSPVDGSVEFSGRYRSYGQLLIINAGGGYTVTLAGMDRINVTAGQFVLAGEPVAVMGDGSTRTAAAAAIGATQPVLYIELRKDGAAIDPGPWWAKSDIEKARG